MAKVVYYDGHVGLVLVSVEGKHELKKHLAAMRELAVPCWYGGSPWYSDVFDLFVLVRPQDADKIDKAIAMAA